MVKYILCIMMSLVVLTTARSQDIFRPGDLSKLNVDRLSDADIARVKQQLEAGGQTLDQVGPIAIAKGLPPAELEKLRSRLGALSQASATTSTAAQDPGTADRGVQKDSYQVANQQPRSNVFGAGFFTTTSLTFEPNLRIPTPVNYTLGADDQLIINVSGYQETSQTLTVSPEGTVNIPQVGSVLVSGLTIEAATTRIRERMGATAYPTIRSGLSKLNVSLGRIKSIHVIVIGAAKPGNYTVSSLSTVYNAIIQSGGPDAINSYRDIELRRNNQLYRKIDLYQFLTRGDQTGNVVLKEGDVINFPVYKIHVTLSGEVKRPGIFELKPGESVQDLLFFAGGFTEKGYRAAVKIQQLTDSARLVKDLPKAEFNNYHPADGDKIEVGAVLDRMINAVNITGAVYRPAQYELSPGLTLSGLIRKAGGITEDVYPDRGLLTRTRPDKTLENIAFNVNDILNGKQADIPLRRDDNVAIASITTFRSTYTVTIEGEVRSPGPIPYAENLRLRDVLFKAGGFTDAASTYRIEVSRRVIKDNVANAGDTTAKVYELTTDRSLALDNDPFVLAPYDIVTIRKNPGYQMQERVTVTGEVNFPGTYTLESKQQRVSDILRRAGGLTRYAYDEGIFLSRPKSQASNVLLQSAATIQRSMNDSTSNVLQEIGRTNEKIAIDARKVLAKPGSIEDYILRDGDVVEVLRKDPLVTVNGEVLIATTTNYIRGRSLRYYLSEAGGTTDLARRSKIYVLYPNGEVDRTRSALFGLLRSYPDVRTGSEIVVPKKPDRKSLSTTEVVGLFSGLTSVITLVIFTVNALK